MTKRLEIGIWTETYPRGRWPVGVQPTRNGRSATYYLCPPGVFFAGRKGPIMEPAGGPTSDTRNVGSR